jgi:ANTAR domain
MIKNHGETGTGTAGPGAESGSAPADLPGASLGVPEDAIVRRTRDGWRVGGTDVPDLTCAMVLADLLAAELAADQPAGHTAGHTAGLAAGLAADDTAGDAAGHAAERAERRPAERAAGRAAERSAGRPAERPAAPAAELPAGRPAEPAAETPADGQSSTGAGQSSTGETSRLRATIGQLEHALTARIRVEQAIGVLAERHRIQPRQAFEQLRTAARNRGRRVIDIASDVVASATNPLLQLPDELSRPRSSARNRTRQPRAVGSE